jgi:DNA invertase Pin-like site-specific DNA recombinase
MRGKIVDAGYARVSTLDQDLTIQLEALDRAGCWPIHEEKKSGVKERPVREEVLRQLQRGDTLTVHRLDRLGRSVADLLNVVQDLDQRGVRFRVLTQPVDTGTAAGRMFLTLLAAFAEFERELLLERTAAGRARRKEQGLPHGRPAWPFEKDHATVIEDRARLLQEAARRIVDDHEPLSRIVDDFNARGYRPGKATRWRVTHLRRILLNERVTPIIGEDVHRKLVGVFSNTQNQRQRLGRPAEHLLSGILVCGRDGCGQPLYAASKTGKTGIPQPVYRCKKATGSGGRFNGCGSTVVSLHRADAWATEAFVAAVVSPEFADALNRRQAELLAEDMTAEQLDDWRQEIAELGQVLETRFGTAEMKRRRDDLQRLVREATARLMARPDLQALVDLPRSEAALRAAWDSWSVAERRAWLRRIILHIAVLPGEAHHRGSDVGARLDPQWRV